MDDRQFFSQAGEDFLLWNALGSERRYFVDVGAFDGIHLSNSYSFELAGWSGVCVEAHPRFAEICRRNRPGSHVIHGACVGPEAGDSVAFLSEPLGLLSGIRADLTEGMQRRYGNRGMHFAGFDEIDVPAMTLAQALERCGAPREIGFVSIDVEGTELDVLRGFDFARYECEVFVVEANSAEARSALDHHMLRHGYTNHRRLGQNFFFARDHAIGHALATAVVECDIEDSLHPDGERATHPRHRARHIVERP